MLLPAERSDCGRFDLPWELRFSEVSEASTAWMVLLVLLVLLENQLESSEFSGRLPGRRLK
jgi:hypothetical protein